MISSRDRILATHVGSLPRNPVLTDLLIRREAGERIDSGALAAEMDKAVADIVERQRSAGIDIGNDGEQQRVGFQTYVPERMSGFGGESKRRRGRGPERISGDRGDAAAALPEPEPQPQRTAGDRGREISGHRTDRGGARAR